MKWHGTSEAELAAIQEVELAKVEATVKLEKLRHGKRNGRRKYRPCPATALPGGRRTGARISAEVTARLSLGRQNQFKGGATGVGERTGSETIWIASDRELGICRSHPATVGVDQSRTYCRKP